MIKVSTLLRSVLVGICAMMLPASLWAQAVGDTFTEGGFNCKVLAVDAATKSGEIEITGAASEVGESLEIPASLKHAFAEDEWIFAVTTIGEKAFAESKTLKTVKFPSLAETSLAVIGPLAFHHCTALQSINLEDTKIEVLETLFTKDPNDEICLDSLIVLSLPETLKEIKSYAMQFLGIQKMTIPASVTAIGEGILEGNIYLEEFYWKGAQVTSLPISTFLGDDALKVVYFLTVNDIAPDGLTDYHFECYGEGEKVKVYVTPASYAILTANGYDNEKSVFSTLAADTQWTDIKAPRLNSQESVQGSASNHRQDTYNLQGMRISVPRKGSLYIHNGRKFIYR